MELRHIRYFLTVADTGSLSAAAERLRVAQPPLGRQIRDLERDIGANLFERSSRGMRLTAAGHAFLPRAQDILSSVGEAVNEVRLTVSGSAGRLAVGYSDEFMNGLLPRAVERFLADCGNVDLELEMNANADTAVAVRDGRYDAGLIIAPAPSHLDGISVQPIDTVPLCLAVARGHPLASRPMIALRDLAGERIVTGRIAPTSGYYIRLMQLFRRRGMQPEFHANIHPTEMICNLVSGGYGVALVSPDAVSPARNDLLLQPLSDLDAVLERCAVWRTEKANPLAAAFIKTLRDEAAATPAASRRSLPVSTKALIISKREKKR